MPVLRKFLLYGGSAGFAGFSYYLYSAKNNLSASEALPIAPSRSVQRGLDKTGLKLMLFQYQSCPFCCKVRAYLNYRGLDYDVVEVHPITRKQIKFSDYRKVPILTVDSPTSGEKIQLNDSTMIVSALQSFLVNKEKKFEEINNCFPVMTSTDENGKQKSEIMNLYNTMFDQYQTSDDEQIQHEIEWRKWADQKLVHMLSPNIYRTPKESVETFRKFSEVGNWEEHFSDWERMTAIYLGAAAMYLVGKRLKTKHNLKDDVRESLYNSCFEWVKALKGQTYNGGDKPNLADLAVYGVLNSIEGTRTFDDVMTNTQIGKWYFQLKQDVESHAGSEILKK